jgi:hypothetical protein
LIGTPNQNMVGRYCQPLRKSRCLPVARGIWRDDRIVNVACPIEETTPKNHSEWIKLNDLVSRRIHVDPRFSFGCSRFLRTDICI